MVPGFHVKLERDDHAWTISCGGELDLATAPRLEEAFELCVDMRPSSMFLDGRDLTFVDSSGVWAMVGAARRCRELDIPFDIAVSDQVRDILHRTGLAERLLLGRPAHAPA